LKGGSVARRYAKALLAIGVEKGTYEQQGQEVERFATLLREHADLAEVLSNPTYAQEKRRAVLQQMIDRLRPSPMVRNLLLLLLDRNRIRLVPDLSREYRQMVDDHVGRIRANVTSAQPLAAEEAKRITGAIEQRTGKKVILTQNTDNELIAGIVTQIGSVIYDGSIRTQLAEMRESLLAGR
jgi:F-type H+-transporting ATPase subunit delta